MRRKGSYYAFLMVSLAGVIVAPANVYRQTAQLEILYLHLRDRYPDIPKPESNEPSEDQVVRASTLGEDEDDVDLGEENAGVPRGGPLVDAVRSTEKSSIEVSKVLEHELRAAHAAAILENDRIVNHANQEMLPEQEQSLRKYAQVLDNAMESIRQLERNAAAVGNPIPMTAESGRLKGRREQIEQRLAKLLKWAGTPSERKLEWNKGSITQIPAYKRMLEDSDMEGLTVVSAPRFDLYYKKGRPHT
ncbi:uncharacterized protein EV422DRAFT_430468 [Fimicolochytrium jonesii]|uniref:uncharacterized protein n=1 Tax=Fimicolochytrium jonesii TaxID=1396493 RepID=UPI0022FE65C6|nr:uncharacterized protein EV422DRAFT_430468 [Fimicolochytrium jonesii]KAI8821753.1 hypothetical protein EV422DRAFT_430468 [Fimicolochytrium jonesii]